GTLESDEDYCVCLLRSSFDAALASFPGGELASADRALARANWAPGDDVDGDVFLGLRVGAIRSTFESTGMMLAASPPPSFARQELQKILVREGPMAFHAFLDDWGISLRPGDVEELAWLYISRALQTGPPGPVPDLWGEGTSPPEEHVFLARVPEAQELCWTAALPAERFSGIL
ncbi:unnamed protein product, partial [Prorocentrum cordatum]